MTEELYIIKNKIPELSYAFTPIGQEMLDKMILKASRFGLEKRVELHKC